MTAGRKPLGASQWRQLAGLDKPAVGAEFKALLICPDDDAPLDWMEQSNRFVCPHCQRAFEPAQQHLELLPTAEPYALSEPDRLALAQLAALSADEPLDSVMWNVLTNRLGDIRGKRVLDLGAGRGKAALWFAAQGAHVAALDAVAGEGGLASIADAANKENLTIDLIQADLARLPIASESIDIVFSSRVLAWQRRPERLAKEIGRVLKPEGRYYAIGEPLGPLPPECLDGRRQTTMAQADYAGILREGGMKTETVLADGTDSAIIGVGLLARLRRSWRIHSSTEDRLLVGQVTPDLQLPQIRWKRASAPGA